MPPANPLAPFARIRPLLQACSHSPAQLLHWQFFLLQDLPVLPIKSIIGHVRYTSIVQRRISMRKWDGSASLQASAGDVRASSAAAGAMAALLPLVPGHHSGQQGLRSGRASNEALPADVYAERSITGLTRLLVRNRTACVMRAAIVVLTRLTLEHDVC